jgi:hypothetical protein
LRLPQRGRLATTSRKAVNGYVYEHVHVNDHGFAFDVDVVVLVDVDVDGFPTKRR